MASMFEIATSVSSPLGLSGLVAMIMLYVFKSIASRNIASQLTPRTSFKVLMRIVNGLLCLSLTAMVLGFVGFIFGKVYEAPLQTAPTLIQVPKATPVQHLETHGKQSPIIQNNQGTIVINGTGNSLSGTEEKK